MGLLKKLLAIIVCFFLGSSAVLLHSVNVTDAFLQPQIIKAIIMDPEFSISTTSSEQVSLTEAAKNELFEKLKAVDVSQRQYDQLLKSKSVTNVYALVGEAVVAQLRQVPSDINSVEDIDILCTRELSKIADEVDGLNEKQTEVFITEFSSIMQGVYEVLTSPMRRALMPNADFVLNFRVILIAAIIILMLLLKVAVGKFSKAFRTGGVIIAAVSIPFLLNVFRLVRIISELGEERGSSAAITALKGLKYGPLMLRTGLTALTGVVLAVYGIHMARREYVLEDGTIPVVLEDKRYFEEKNIL